MFELVAKPSMFPEAPTRYSQRRVSVYMYMHIHTYICIYIDIHICHIAQSLQVLRSRQPQHQEVAALGLGGYVPGTVAARGLMRSCQYFIHLHIYIYIYLSYAYTCMCIYIYAHAYVRIHLRTYMYVCIFSVYIYTYIYIYVYICTSMHITYTNTYLHILLICYIIHIHIYIYTAMLGIWDESIGQMIEDPTVGQGPISGSRDNSYFKAGLLGLRSHSSVQKLVGDCISRNLGSCSKAA